MIVGVVVLGLVKRWAERHPREAARWSWRSRMTVGLGVLSIVLALTGVVSWLAGPWAITVGPWAISVTRAYKPIGVALDMLLAATLLGLPFRRCSLRWAVSVSPR